MLLIFGPVVATTSVVFASLATRSEVKNLPLDTECMVNIILPWGYVNQMIEILFVYVVP